MSNEQCKNIPIELVVATTDPNLYDAENKKWLWDGQMYWAVECLAHHQRTVSDRVLPQIRPEHYQPLHTTPTSWNFCRSKNCGPNSEAMHIVFTFNPHSTNPNDFLQYVIDIPCHITDMPRHDIKDKSGKKFYLNIIEISKLSDEPYVEIWLAKTHEDKQLTVSAIESPHDVIHSSKSGNGMTILIVVLMLILFIAILVSGWFYYRHTQIPKTPRVSNIY